MESVPKMLAPICLVENNKEKLLVNQQAIQILDQISQPVVVVAIVGLYRTGKSYLMNQLAGQNHGFPLGSTVQSETKGIWMWCVPHPFKPNHTLVLLDTEGLGDVEKPNLSLSPSYVVELTELINPLSRRYVTEFTALNQPGAGAPYSVLSSALTLCSVKPTNSILVAGDPKNDSWIFALAVLLCSCFVYNSMSTINHQALEQLHYVTELTELIKAKSTPRPDGVEDSTEFVSFFPDFIWTVRDFTLELKLNGHPITEDEYLENALKLTQGKNPKIQTSNLPRECIRHFFPKRKCFVFDRPTNDKDLLANIEKVSEKQLDPKFQEQTNTFSSYIFTHARTKTLREGIMVTGNRLGTLAVTYVEAINSGAVPCLENAVITLAQRENSAAMQRAADYYSQQMAQRVKFPTDSLQELLDVHMACEREAIAIFMEHSFKDENQEFQKKLVEITMNKKGDFLLQNEESSVQYCQAKLNELSKALMESISAGSFSVPGGHKLYMETKERVEQDYWQVPRKGVKAKEVFQRFLESQVVIEKSILQSDKALTNKEKAVAAVDRAKKEAAEKEQELLKQKLQEQQQQMEAQEKSLKENIAQLKEKLQMEREHLLREQNMMLEHKLKVQKDLLDEGFRTKSEEMNVEISQLKHMIDTTKNDDTPWIARTLDKLGDELTSILSAPAKLIGQVVKVSQHRKVKVSEKDAQLLPGLVIDRAHGVVMKWPPKRTISANIHKSSSQFFSRGSRAAMFFLGGVISSIREVATQHNPEALPPHTHCSNTEVNKSEEVHQFQRLFARLAGDEIEVRVAELMNVLNKTVISTTELKTHGFSIDTWHSIVATMDSDTTGKLGFEELE
ncbi:Guanylate-binding protein 6 [Saguinus oedipus]|uniref:Guanylate-binding protein 6 n=1 Tax=Saguinus oedipus TaxID=9490 RepID=A0ABQ9VCH0_SAGOE|nr:Guanylate-binding protein 6 [Saguinus oedipus]